MLGTRLPATGLIWALRAQKVGKKVRKWVPGTSRPRGAKKSKRSRKRVEIDNFLTISTRFRLRFGLFGPRGREVPGTHFRTFFRLFGPWGPKSALVACSRHTSSQTWSLLHFLVAWESDQRLTMFLVSHYSAISDTIACDTPYSAKGFIGKLLLRYPPPSKPCLWIAIGYCTERCEDVAAQSAIPQKT